MDILVNFATWFIGMFQAGAKTFVDLVVGIIPLVIILMTAFNAVVAWIAATGVLQAAAYDATGPVLPGPAIPTTATVGQALGVSIAPSWDLWSSVASMAWDFGDGTTAAGPSATHAWSQPGTYTVTVSGCDTFGDSTARSGQITVAPQPPQASVSTPDPTPSRGSSGPAGGTTGTVAGVTVRLPGASAAKTPLPTKLSKAALRKLPALIRQVNRLEAALGRSSPLAEDEGE